MKKGYTLIELMIAVTIISIMVSLGLSAYGKARDRQIGTLAGEQILTILRTAQSDAVTGKKDCNGKYQGQLVEIILPNLIHSRSVCENEEGVIVESVIPGIVFTSAQSFTFNPLTKGIEVAGGLTESTISFASSANLSYSLKINNSGTIEYLGVTP